MKFSDYVRNLEKRKIISIKPHPLIPFILVFIILILGAITYVNIDKNLSYAFFFLASFTFIFAVLHWIVVKIVGVKR